MKRTPLTRKTPLKAKTGLKAQAPLKSKAPMKKRRASKQGSGRAGTYRSRSYLSWVKTLTCVVCSAPADDPHHIIGVGHLGGVGTKAPDQYVMPVCRRHHDHIHATPALWPLQWGWIEATLARAMREFCDTEGEVREIFENSLRSVSVESRLHKTYNGDPVNER